MVKRFPLSLLFFLLVLGSTPATAQKPFVPCLKVVLGLTPLPRPAPEPSGAEVEVRVRSKLPPHDVQMPIWSMLTTADGTVRPVLKGFEAPPFLRSLAERIAIVPEQFLWDQLTVEQQIALIEYVGTEKVKSRQRTPWEAGAFEYFYEISRRIDGIVFKDVLPIEVPPGPPLRIFGVDYPPGKHLLRMRPIGTSVEYALPRDMLGLESIELHFRTQPGQDITPGENALSVRHFLAARGYDRGKQHQHALSAASPSPAVFGGGDAGLLMATAVAAKLVVDANLLSGLIVVRDLRKSLESREDKNGVQSTPMRSGELSDVVQFLHLLASEAPEALHRDYDAAFKTFNVGVRGPAKFPGWRWSLEFRDLFAETLRAHSAPVTVRFIDSAKFKMQALSGAKPGGLPEDVATIQRWFRALSPLVDSITTVENLFASNWTNQPRSLQLLVAPEPLKDAIGPRARELLTTEYFLLRHEFDWILHDWSTTHYMHLSSDPSVNEQRKKRVLQAQIAAVKALESLDAEDTDAARDILLKFIDDGELQSLALHSLMQR